MNKPKIYLETTMFNYYFDSDRDAHEDTIILFEEIRAGKYDAYTSDYVIDELLNADEPKRSKMLALIKEYNITTIETAHEIIEGLADKYITQSVIPIKHRYDALHIATATVNNLDYVFSLNFKHINKFKTKTMTSLINVKEGYKPVIIISPMEITDNDENE